MDGSQMDSPAAASSNIGSGLSEPRMVQHSFFLASSQIPWLLEAEAQYCRPYPEASVWLGIHNCQHSTAVVTAGRAVVSRSRFHPIFGLLFLPSIEPFSVLRQALYPRLSHLFCSQRGRPAANGLLGLLLLMAASTRYLGGSCGARRVSRTPSG